jgi:hypothetical protein
VTTQAATMNVPSAHPSMAYSGQWIRMVLTHGFATVV